MTRRSLAALAVAAAAALATAAPAAAKTVWLCKPGGAPDVCERSLRTAIVSPAGKRLAFRTPAVRQKVDCFYVYPTTSDQKTPQATLAVDPELRSIALFQAARYAGQCRVFAPVYRQVTIAGLSAPTTVTAEMRETGYADVRAAWREYMTKHNKGRGVVIIGHSQGTFVLRRLVREEVDPKPLMRRRLVSALLLGGDVLVKPGSDRGGDFKNIRACRSFRQTGCVIAFSTFDGPVPADSRFGRPDPGQEQYEVLCTNPAALSGGAGRITPIFPSAPFAPSVIGALTPAVGFTVAKVDAPWVEVPNAYRARCSGGDTDVLQLDPLGGAPALNAVPDKTWGLHLVDANIALGQLTQIVRRQAARWLSRR